MAVAEDIAGYFDVFGVDATLSGNAVSVIYDQPIGVGDGVSAEGPQVQIATASVPSSVFQAALVIPGQGSFEVREHLADGTGVSLLLLTRTA